MLSVVIIRSLCGLAQVDVYSLKHQRDDRDTRVIWEREGRHVTDTFPPPSDLFTECGISHTSVLSPPCLSWKLLSTAAPRNTVVDEFHNIAEGHATLFCEFGLPLFADDVLRGVGRRWTDPTLWEPYISNIPLTAMDKLTSMNGVDKEVVAKHADIILGPYFRRADGENLGDLFDPGRRYRLACNLLELQWEELEHWSKAAWENFLANHHVPWRAVYEEYIKPLSEMCRALLSVWQSRERVGKDGYLHQLIKRYVAGARLVYGEAFTKAKTIFHRLLHLTAQVLGMYHVHIPRSAVIS